MASTKTLRIVEKCFVAICVTISFGTMIMSLLLALELVNGSRTIDVAQTKVNLSSSNQKLESKLFERVAYPKQAFI